MLFTCTSIPPFNRIEEWHKTDLDKSDSQEVVGDYHGVQHDAKELRVGPKRID